jgi:hypothetical protein
MVNTYGVSIGISEIGCEFCSFFFSNLKTRLTDPPNREALSCLHYLDCGGDGDNLLLLR